MTTEHALHLLKLTVPFSREDLKKAYRQQAAMHHPDRFSEDSEKEKQTAIFQDLVKANEFLNKHFDSLHISHLRPKVNRGWIEIPNTWFYRDLENFFSIFVSVKNRFPKLKSAFRIKSNRRFQTFLFSLILLCFSPILIALGMAVFPVYILWIKLLEIGGIYPVYGYKDTWIHSIGRGLPVLGMNLLVLIFTIWWSGFHPMADFFLWALQGTFLLMAMSVGYETYRSMKS